MRFYIASLSILLFLAGCAPTPSTPLAPKLSHYATAQQQCNDFLDGKQVLTKKVEKECEQFLKRLDTANLSAQRLADENLRKGERKELNIEYARDRNRLKLQYETLLEAVKKATLDTIRQDNLEGFLQGVAFPGNTFTEPYYNYMASKAPRFDNDTRYLDFQRQESERLMLKGQHYLQQGKKQKALKLFERAAELNNPQAARSTALLYEDSNTILAISWHQKAVEGGVKESSLNLGHLYEQEGDTVMAQQWYLTSAQAGNAKAQYQLYHFERDKDKALYWLKEAASNGNAQAQYRYALILMEQAKTDEAIDLLQQAAQNNYTQASDYLGTYFYKLKLYDSAFKQLSQSESANAFYLRAKMSEMGAGTPKDYDQAYTFYNRAAALGVKDADQDLQRIARLLSKEQKEKAAREKREQLKRMASMVKQCGAIPNATAIKKGGKRFHIIGTASVPVGYKSFIIYGDDGIDYYLQQARGIQEGDHVDISAMSIGSTTSVSTTSDEEAVKIYQFSFIKECIIEEEEQ